MRHLVVCLFFLATPVLTEWTAWGSPTCFPEQSTARCLYRVVRTCRCQNGPSDCDCLAQERKYTTPPHSSDFCTSGCEIRGVWCAWGPWAAVRQSRCRLQTVRRRRCCRPDSSLVLLEDARCPSNSSSVEARVHVFLRCSGFTPSGLAGLFGTAVVILSAVAAVVLYRMRQRRRRTFVAPPQRTTEEAAVAQGPPSYEECVEVPPPYELAVVQMQAAPKPEESQRR